MRPPPFIVVWIGLWLGLSCASARADWFVVTHVQNAQNSMAQRDVVALFTGRTRTFPSGEPAQPLDLPRASSERIGFYETLTGMDIARVNSYWSRLQFSGQVQPPLVLGSEAQVVAHIKRHPSAIGYLTTAPRDAELRVVFKLTPGTSPP